MHRKWWITGTLIVMMILLSSWGFVGHKQISRMAVFTLPSQMIVFYKDNIQFISDHSVDPDKRRYTDPEEGARHFFDSERYGKSPFDSVPQRWKDAANRYTEDTLKLYGTVPWQIERTYYSLVKAFEQRDAPRILRLSSHLSHYIADASVPLHATQNYNGQLTNQVGIHGFWESRLPELFSAKYNFFVGKAVYINNPLEEAWKILKQSHHYKDSVFSIEKKLSNTFPSDKKYSFSLRNGKLQRQYSLNYSSAFHRALNGMVEKRMRTAIYETGCFWFSAWVDAGQPDLSTIKELRSSSGKKETPRKDDDESEERKILGRPDL